jgi:(2Fe-2S) ferredoxin
VGFWRSTSPPCAVAYGSPLIDQATVKSRSAVAYGSPLTGTLEHPNCLRLTMSTEKPTPEQVAAKLNIGSYTQHVFLCTGPNCCTPEVGLAAWEKLKQTLKDCNLTSTCYRTKVGCLRICQSGPTMLVYPEGTWYHGMTAEKIPQFVQQHLIEGKPVEEWIFARNPIGTEE